eukprot:28634_1
MNMTHGNQPIIEYKLSYVSEPATPRKQMIVMKPSVSPSSSAHKSVSLKSTCPKTPPPRKDLTRLYTQIRSFHTTFILALFEDRQARYSRQTSSLSLSPSLAKNEIKCWDFLRGSPSKMKSKIHSRQKKMSSFRQTRRSSAFMYKPRQNALAKKYHHFVNTPRYKTVSILMALSALYARDICLAFLPNAFDTYILDYALSFIFLSLLMEWILYSLSHYNYFLTFFFWLDIVGTISVLFDIPFVTRTVFDNSSRLIDNNQRFFQILKMARMLKLFRLVHLFKQTARNEIGEFKLDVMMRHNVTVNTDKKERKADRDLFTKYKNSNMLKPQRMGTLTGDSLIQKLMLGVLCKYFMMPLFDVGDIDFHSTTRYQLDSLQTFYTAHQSDIDTNSTIYFDDYQHLITTFNTHNSNAIYLQIVSANDDKYQRNEINDTDALLSLRKTETMTIYLTSSYAILNIKSDVQEESMLNIGLITTIMIVFFIGSSLIKADLGRPLVDPQTFLFHVIDMLTAIIFCDLELDFNREAFMGSVMSTATDIFFSHERQHHFLTQLRNSELINYEDSESDDEDGYETGTFMQFDGTSCDPETVATFENDLCAPSSTSKSAIGSSITSSSDVLLQRYLGNSRPSLEIEFEDEEDDDDMFTAL